MMKALLCALCLSLVACAKEEPPESDYAHSTTGMPPGARQQVMQDLGKAAAQDLQSDAQAEALEAARAVAGEAREIAREIR